MSCTCALCHLNYVIIKFVQVQSAQSVQLTMYFRSRDFSVSNISLIIHLPNS